MADAMTKPAGGNPAKSGRGPVPWTFWLPAADAPGAGFYGLDVDWLGEERVALLAELQGLVAEMEARLNRARPPAPSSTTVPRSGSQISSP